MLDNNNVLPELLVLVVVVEVDKVGDRAASLRRIDVDEDGLFCRVWKHKKFMFNLSKL